MPKKKRASALKTRAQKAGAPRKLKKPNYKSFKLAKRIKHDKKLISAPKLLRLSIVNLKANWKLYGGLSLVYGLLSIFLVRGLGGQLDLQGLKESFEGGLEGSYGNLLTGLTLFSYLVGSSGSSASEAGSVYQPILLIIMSLVIIWALRQNFAGKKVTVKQAFYSSTYPLIPFVLVLIVIGLQLLPLTIGSWLYSVVISSGIAVTAVEKFIWALLALVLATLSLYMVSSSVFALYIVSLPNMAPLKALRSARQLVLHRRWAVMRKVLFLPLAMILLGAVFMLPFILFVTPLAEWVFFLLGMFALVLTHGYMYTLYRELL